ncbi:RF1M factor, partial [Atractosteus spatula]|nr:RF1M factor [Atractosteus spatula]
MRNFVRQFSLRFYKHCFSLAVPPAARSLRQLACNQHPSVKAGPLRVERLQHALRKQLRRHCCSDTRDLLQEEPVKKHLEGLFREYEQVTHRLQNPALSDSERRALSRRQVELLPTANVLEETERAWKDLKDVEAILQSAEGKDDQMVMLVKEEQNIIAKRIEALQQQLLENLVPSDRHDGSDVILEVAAGRTTGGDICQQFTREIFEMYLAFASYKNWAFEVLNYTPAEYGGLHHAAARISGENVYKYLKYEGGTHRVQRIPEVGLSSRMQRIHTGTMTIIVLPQPSEIDIHLDPKDLRIDTFKSKGAGGQSVNTTDSAVRIVHIPTGKVGTRSQSERVRTYNFTQDRVTDHRIGCVARDIKEFLRGGEPLDEFIRQLLKYAEKEALLEMLSNSSPSKAGE